MRGLLDKNTVLVLNRLWQAIGTKTPAQAFCMMAAGAATALDIRGESEMSPVGWTEWLALPVRPGDNAVLTVRGPIRCPTVIIAINPDFVPRRRPTLSSRAIRERDNETCQYTGRRLPRGRGTIDHVIPRHQGGRTTWENCVLCDEAVNCAKANRTPEQAGLKLLRRPKAPPEIPVWATIRNEHGVPEWEPFLLRRRG